MDHVRLYKHSGLLLLFERKLFKHTVADHAGPKALHDARLTNVPIQRC